jgi:hypothetical protein
MREAIQSHQRFSEEEVQQVLRRAAELQRRSSTVPTDARALSLAELEQIAAESGIDVQQIHRAILELGAPHLGAGSLVLGAPPRVHLERVVDGEIASGAFEPLVAELRRTLGQAGQVSVLGGTLTWSAPNTSSGPVEVTVSRVEGGTRIGLDARFGGLLGATLGGIGGGLGGGLGGPLGAAIGQLTHSSLAAAGTVGVALGLAFLLARSIYAAIVRRRARVLQQLIDHLSQQLAALASKAP